MCRHSATPTLVHVYPGDIGGQVSYLASWMKWAGTEAPGFPVNCEPFVVGVSVSESGSVGETGALRSRGGSHNGCIRMSKTLLSKLLLSESFLHEREKQKQRKRWWRLDVTFISQPWCFCQH